jgi:hypothetical protein
MTRFSPRPILVMLLCAAAVVCHGQEAPEKEDLAVLALSHYEWQIPGGALSLVDEQVEEAFIGLRQFNVIGMRYRLDSEGVDQFIEKIREVNEQNIELPETVRLGQEAFAEADFSLLVDSSLVVVPVMTRYELEKVGEDLFEAQIEVDFTFIDVAEAKTFGNFSVDVAAKAASGREAVQRAADRIAPELVVELRKTPEFQIKTGILEMRGRQVLLEPGANMGVRKGDEYVIVDDTVLSGGHIVSEESGLMIVNDVMEEIAFATLIYSQSQPSLGDQLRQVPRIGLDTGAHARLMVTTTPDADSRVVVDQVVGMIGVRQSISRGFLSHRPVVGIDVPFSIFGPTELPGLIFNIYGGGEINWYLWRFQVVPTAAIGIGASIPTSDTGTFQVSHAGGFVELLVSYLLNHDIKLSATVGFSAWISLSAAGGDTYVGPHFGLGGTYKY